jgi:hypothetical protein
MPLPTLRRCGEPIAATIAHVSAFDEYRILLLQVAAVSHVEEAERDEDREKTGTSEKTAQKTGTSTFPGAL